MRRLISCFRRSMALEVRRRLWWAVGRVKSVKLCGRFSSIHVAKFGCSLGIGGDEVLGSLLGGGAIGAVKNTVDGAPDRGALPGHGVKNGGLGGFSMAGRYSSNWGCSVSSERQNGPASRRLARVTAASPQNHSARAKLSIRVSAVSGRHSLCVCISTFRRCPSLAPTVAAWGRL